MQDQAQQPNIALSLPVQAIEVVLAGLGKLPLETSIGVHQHIVSETQRQLQEAQAKVPKAAALAKTPKAVAVAATQKEEANAQP